jgi:hypothetical protein
VTDSKDLPVQRHQVATFDPTPDQTSIQAQAAQLAPGDDPMLSFRQLTNDRRRPLSRCNALSIKYLFGALHRDAVLAHAETLAESNARVVR